MVKMNGALYALPLTALPGLALRPSRRARPKGTCPLTALGGRRGVGRRAAGVFSGEAASESGKAGYQLPEGEQAHGPAQAAADKGSLGQFSLRSAGGEEGQVHCRDQAVKGLGQVLVSRRPLPQAGEKFPGCLTPEFVPRRGSAAAD